MNTATNTTEELVNREYKYGFVTEIEADTVPRGLNEAIIRMISAKKSKFKTIVFGSLVAGSLIISTVPVMAWDWPWYNRNQRSDNRSDQRSDNREWDKR